MKKYFGNTKYSGGDNMTSKELTYLEDALSKENFIIEKLNVIISKFTDENIISDLKNVLKSHDKNSKKLEKILMEE